MNVRANLNNRMALEYNKEYICLIDEICAPLHHFGITFFNYSRNFTDGTHLYLSNSQKWVELYIANNLQDDAAHLGYYFPHPNITQALWSGFKRDKAFDILYENDMWNGFTIYEHHSDFTEIFDFGSTKENISVINFYLRNKNLLKHVVDEFKEKVSRYIDFNDKRKMILPTVELSVNQIKRVSFVEEDNLNKFYKQIGLSR